MLLKESLLLNKVVLFDQKYNKNSYILQYYYHLK